MYNKICSQCNYQAKTFLTDCPSCGHHLNYHNHCWNCNKGVSSDSNKRCPSCGWFICSKCGACRGRPRCSSGDDRIEENDVIAAHATEGKKLDAKFSERIYEPDVLWQPMLVEGIRSEAIVNKDGSTWDKYYVECLINGGPVVFNAKFRKGVDLNQTLVLVKEIAVRRGTFQHESVEEGDVSFFLYNVDDQGRMVR